jgi:hypothetical protein
MGIERFWLRKYMTNRLKHWNSNISGACLIIAVLSLIAGWRVWLVAREPAHLLSIANELGSIAQDRANPKDIMIPNENGPGLIFFQETEKGLGTYFCGTSSGKCTLLCEQKEDALPYEGSLGWSPSGDFFAFLATTEPNPGKPKIVIYDGSTGEIVATLSPRGNTTTPKFVWLSPRSFACSTYNNGWLVYEEASNGSWLPGRFIQKFSDGEMENIVAITPDSIVWQQQDDIWMYNFGADSSDIIWESVSNKLVSFKYSSATGNLLLNCTDPSGPVLISFRPPKSSSLPGTVLSVTKQEPNIRYSTLTEENGSYTLHILTNAAAKPVNLRWGGTIEEYKLAGNYLYFNGSQEDGLPGIWQYDIDDQSMRCLTMCLEHNLKYTKIVTPLAGMGTNSSGRRINYHIWAPTHISNGKKYPLIIGQMPYRWLSYEQVAASAGFYFATADRTSWFDGLSDWVGDVSWLEEYLVKNANIDTNRVFLCATSAESTFLNQLASEKPNLWKGAVLFNSASLPDLASTRLSTMFIVGGTGDDYGREVGRLTRYQDEAAEIGIPIKLLLQKGSIHVPKSIATERERTVQFAKFLMEN